MAKDAGLNYRQTASDTLEHYYPSRESSLTPAVLQKTGFQHQVYRLGQGNKKLLLHLDGPVNSKCFQGRKDTFK